MFQVEIFERKQNVFVVVVVAVGIASSVLSRIIISSLSTTG
jgi:hypothetical protein